MGRNDIEGAEWQCAHEPDLLRACIEHPEPPRPLSYARQLKADAASWQCLLLWTVSVAGVALGLVFRQWVAVACGLFLLVIYLRIFMTFVRLTRRNPLGVGVIQKLNPLSRPLGLSEAGALLPDGRVVKVAVMTKRARELIEKHGRVEVLFLDDREGGGSLVVGMRPVTEQPEQSP